MNKICTRTKNPLTMQSPGWGRQFSKVMKGSLVFVRPILFDDNPLNFSDCIFIEKKSLSMM